MDSHVINLIMDKTEIYVNLILTECQVIATEDRNTSKETACNVTVTILDVNDNDPEFSNTTYNVRLEEGPPKNTSVINITVCIIKLIKRVVI